MSKKVLIVEDLFIEAKNLEIILKNAGYAVCGTARTLDEARMLAEREQPELALVDIQLKGGGNGIELAGFFRERNMAFIYISANHDHDTLVKAKATQPYGFIVKPFREKDLMVTLEIAQYRHEHSLETAIRKEAQLQERLQQVIKLQECWQVKMRHIAAALQAFLPFDYLSVCTSSGAKAGQLLSYLRVGFDEYQTIGLEEFQVITRLTTADLQEIAQEVAYEKRRCFYVSEDFTTLAAKSNLVKTISDTFSLQSLLLLPIELADGSTFTFAFYSRRPDTYNAAQYTLLDRLQHPLAAAMENMLEAAPQLNESQKTVGADRQAGFEGIVGNSHLLLGVFDDITQVAPVDTSVLILGESGTGKERIAESVHRLSQRNQHPFVKVNCTALPFHLIESELFGHEKGSFTGATDRRIGKFERADGGTIFLDEIGDMPYELQAKLLRVLQEKEIERIGGKTPVKVNVRVIAATNRNLEKEVAAGRFRLDLYYRLNIFPVALPPLRNRKDDIPLLIRHFISIYNNKANRQVKTISAKGLQEALDYQWPGNIRELENLVERAVLMAKDPELKDLAIPKQQLPAMTAVSDVKVFKSIDQNEREHIIAVLRHCKGKVWGPGGAAELLELPPSTLNSRMKKLGITRDMIL